MEKGFGFYVQTEEKLKCSFLSYILFRVTEYYLWSQIKEDEMGRTCIAYVRYKKCFQNFSKKISIEEATRDT
jgi:hypothetical protein